MYGRLIRGALFISAVLAANEILYKTKDLYRLVISGVISVKELLTVWMTLLPVIFYQIDPESVAIAILARYFFWLRDNEILTQRSMGRSCWQIARPAILVAVCTGIFTAGMSIYALPASFGVAEQIRSAAVLRIRPSMLNEGIQNQITPTLSISFERWRAADVIENVMLTDDRKPGKYTLVTAKRGYFIETGGDYVLALEDGDSFAFPGKEGEVKHASFDQLAILLAPEPGSLPERHGGYYEADIGTLLNPPEDVRQNRAMWAHYVAEGHNRIVNPLRCVGCALLVLGVLVPGRQGHAELAIRLALAAGLVFIENIASTIIFSAAERNVGDGFFFYLLPAVSGGLGALLLCWGDMHFHRWSQWKNLLPHRRARKRIAGERAITRSSCAQRPSAPR
jgi:lipopolysaccharide export system permease protein